METANYKADLEPNTKGSFQDETQRNIYKFDAISELSKTRRLYLEHLVKKLTKNYARHRRMELGDIDTALATAVLSCARSLEMTVTRASVQQDYHKNIDELLNQIDSKTQNRTLHEELISHLKEPNHNVEDPCTSLRRNSYNKDYSSRINKPCAEKQRFRSFHGKELSLKKSAPLAVVSIDPHCNRNQPPGNRPPGNVIIPQEHLKNTDPYMTYLQSNTEDLTTNLSLPVPPPMFNKSNTVPYTPVASTLVNSMSEMKPLKSVSQGTEIMNSGLQESNMWSGHGWENIQPWVNYMYANQFMTINIPFTMSPHAHKDTQYVGDGNCSEEIKSKMFLPPPPPKNINNMKAECQSSLDEHDSKSAHLLMKEFYTPVTHSTGAEETVMKKNKYAELLKSALCSPDHWESIEDWLNHEHYFPKPVNPSIPKRKNIQLKRKQKNYANMSSNPGRKHSLDEGKMPQTFQHLKSRYKSRQPPPKSSKSNLGERDIVYRPKSNIPKSREPLQYQSKKEKSRSTFSTLHKAKPNSHTTALSLYSPLTNSPAPSWLTETSEDTNKTLTPNKNEALSKLQPTPDLLDVESLLSKEINFGEDNDTIIKGLEDMFKSEDELENKQGNVDRINMNVSNDTDLLRDLEDDDIYELTKCLEEGLEQTTSKVEKDATSESISKKEESNCEDEGNQSSFEQKLNTFSTSCENISEGMETKAFAVKPVTAPSIWPCEAHYQRLHLCQKMDKICDENWKKYNRIKIKFGQLFGDNSEDELAPQSPIEETRAFVQSCKRRIVPWLLRHLTPYYKCRRIHERSLFKVVARHLGMRIVEWNRYPSEKQVQGYIQNYFHGHREITCLSDIL